MGSRKYDAGKHQVECYANQRDNEVQSAWNLQLGLYHGLCKYFHTVIKALESLSAQVHNVIDTKYNLPMSWQSFDIFFDHINCWIGKKAFGKPWTLNSQMTLLTSRTCSFVFMIFLSLFTDVNNNKNYRFPWICVTIRKKISTTKKPIVIELHEMLFNDNGCGWECFSFHW